MSLLKILDEKLQGSVDIKTLLGENVSVLEGITFDDDTAAKISASLFNQMEAETNAGIIAKVRDTENKAARKAVMDSIDAAISTHVAVLGDKTFETTKDKTKGILDAYKAQIEALTSDNMLLNEKIKAGITDADSKAILQTKESEIAQLKLGTVPKTEYVLLKEELDKLKKTHVAKEDFDAMKNELKDSKKKIEKLDKLTFEDQIVNRAISGNFLSEDIKGSELKDVMILSAVNKYVDSELFGSQGLKAKLVLNDVTRRLEVVQSEDPTLPISTDGKILTVEDIIQKAAVKYNIHSKGQAPTNVPFNFTSQAPTGGSTKFNEKAAMAGFKL